MAPAAKVHDIKKARQNVKEKFIESLATLQTPEIYPGEHVRALHDFDVGNQELPGG